MSALLKLRQKAGGTLNGPCHQLGKETDVGDESHYIACGGNITTVYINTIAESLKGVERDANRQQPIQLTFSHTYGGLVAKPLPATYDVAKTRHETKPLVRNSPDSEVEGFAVCGRDGKWVWANAKIDGDSVIVWSDAVKDPVKVRYAFQSNPTCNLYNKAGFPAGPFEK